MTELEYSKLLLYIEVLTELEPEYGCKTLERVKNSMEQRKKHYDKTRKF